MTGAVNPYQRKQKQQTENTTNEQQPSSHTDGSSTVPTSTAIPDASQS
jgi:hypothetical protein